MVKLKAINLVELSIFLIICTILFSLSTTIIPVFLASCIFYSVIILFVIMFVKFIEKKELSELGLIFRRIISKLLIGLIIFAGLSVIQIIPALLGKSFGSEPKLHSIFSLLVQGMYSIIFVGFGEEFIFRGYFLTRLIEVFKSKLWAVVISSILFGLWHYIYNQSIGQVIFTTFWGLLFSILRLKIKDSIVPLSFAHGLYDTLTWII